MEKTQKIIHQRSVIEIKSMPFSDTKGEYKQRLTSIINDVQGETGIVVKLHDISPERGEKPILIVSPIRKPLDLVAKKLKSIGYSFKQYNQEIDATNEDKYKVISEELIQISWN
ncbi:MAG: hypothetical protein WCX73_02775 [Candidatus Pacearchaeota archaeon]|jgi:hypothetical protein